MKPSLLRPIIIAILSILGLLVGVGGYAAYQEYTGDTAVRSFEACASANGSSIQESYPATCITKRGKRFIQPVEEVTPPVPTGKDMMPVQEFICPKTAWVDCMPSPDQQRKIECTDEFLSWANTHCPNFEGAAY